MPKPDYILLIDDDQTVNFLHRTLLENTQAAKEIFCARNGEDAFSKIHEIETKAKPHEKSLYILLDLNMPVLDGYEFLEELKTAKVDLKITVYVLSVFCESREKKNLSSYPIAGFIEKPLSLQEIERIHSDCGPKCFNQVGESFGWSKASHDV